MEIPGYEIERCIGHGGMASAYLARQISLDRKVVLKILDTSVTDSRVSIERFLNEGRIVASLQHPHIITTYDIGSAGTDVFISMEFVDGGDLKQRLREGPYSPGEALDLIEKIASGLAAAHAQGIVHRDVKPGNILFRRDGTPLLSDFGIAKRLSGDADLTGTGMFVGSPNYMAPEQSDAGPIDGRVDIYALGVIFYEMLTGHKPYESESVIDVILKHKKEPVPELPAGLEEYQELLDLMMAKDRNDRFRDAQSLLHYIDRLRGRSGVAGSGGSNTPPHLDAGAGNGGRAVKRIDLAADSRRPLRTALGIVALVCALAYGALLVVEWRMTAPPAPPPLPESAEIEIIVPDHIAGDTPADTQRGIEKVADALAWLGQHSLNEYRLTAPPKDNAYYYFSRLAQLDPGNPAARRGLADIAARYAVLAEREIAAGNRERARNYIAIGLQVDPDNGALSTLQDLAVPVKRGFLRTLLGLLK